MKAYVITVNGVPYNVEVEEVSSFAQQPRPQVTQYAPQPAQAPAAPPAAPTPTPTPTPAAAPAPVTSGTASSTDAKIESPLPGTLLDFKVKVGDVVKQNDVVAIVEAMKMENEIVAPQAGTITSLAVSKGASLNAGDVIMTLKV